MEQEIFDEVEHWLRIIKIWEKENNDADAVPNEILLALEMALEKAVFVCRENKKN